MDYVTDSLAKIGYGVDWKGLDALDFGVPQRRERVSIVAIRDASPHAFPWPVGTVPMTPLKDLLQPDPPASMTVSARIEKTRKKAHTSAVTSHRLSGTRTNQVWSPAIHTRVLYVPRPATTILLVNGKRRLTTREMLRLQGFPDEYRLEVPITTARKLTGHAVAVPVVKAVVSLVHLATPRRPVHHSPISLLSPPVVCIIIHMRLHIQLEDDLVADIDRRAGPRRRSAFITALIRRGLEDEHRWDEIEASLGSITDTGHEWDANPAKWVRSQRRNNPKRSG